MPEKNDIKWWVQYVVIPLVVLVAGALLAYFLPNPVPDGSVDWQIKIPTKHIVIAQDTDSHFQICYKSGDGERIGIDNSNSIDPNKGNFRFIVKGNCQNFGIESGPNIGVFLLGNAKQANGTYKQN